jgi:hypothetical protein
MKRQKYSPDAEQLSPLSNLFPIPLLDIKLMLTLAKILFNHTYVAICAVFEYYHSSDNAQRRGSSYLKR